MSQGHEAVRETYLPVLRVRLSPVPSLIRKGGFMKTKKKELVKIRCGGILFQGVRYRHLDLYPYNDAALFVRLNKKGNLKVYTYGGTLVCNAKPDFLPRK